MLPRHTVSIDVLHALEGAPPIVLGGDAEKAAALEEAVNGASSAALAQTFT